ncbi:MAG: hypothetical protein LBF71_00850 [Campylobacteraceae bacterium]|jgi:excinuclease UvrABC ATPase subunit|nr:hypothetical protein [Campylobacteraceae bacterium]
MKKITISISAKSFDITLEDEFARFFSEEIERLFKNKNSLEIKDILAAFIQECHDKFENEKAIREVSEKIELELF